VKGSSAIVGKKVADEPALALLGRIRGRRLLILRLLEALTRPLGRLSKAQASELAATKQILVFAPGQLGDIMMMIPFLRGLRSHFPAAHIAVLGSAKLEAPLLEQRLADELIPVRTPWSEFSSRWRIYNPFGSVWSSFVRTLLIVRRRRFDVSFMPGFCDLRHNLALWVAGANRRVAYVYAGGRSLVTDIVEPDLARPHYADLCLRELQSLGIEATRNNMYLRVRKGDRESAERFLAERGVSPNDLVIGIHSGARLAVRQWGERQFREVARRVIDQFGAKVLWFTDPANDRNGELEPGMVAVSLPLREFQAVLSHCQLVVCNDSGPMHMAAALGVPTVAIFGPNYPAWFSPLGHGHRVVIRQDVWCRPCADRCMFDEPYCLTTIPVEQVMDAVAEALNSKCKEARKVAGYAGEALSPK
jgi:heptosyltransferase II